jgi:glutamine cyclotransferase
MPIMSRNFGLILMIALCFAAPSCGSDSGTGTGSGTNSGAGAPKYSYVIVLVYPHDTAAFTQGLIFQDGKLLESTGQEGQSTLRSVDLDSGQVVRKVDVPSQYFAEGMTLLNGKLYQLTWQHQLGFIYDYQTFEKVGQFNYQGEGWGLTNDGKSLILSDGSNRIRFLNPVTFSVTKTIAVTDNGKPVSRLNELEFIQGEIYANIWHDERIVTINPDTGAVTSWIDFTGLLKPGEARDSEAVLNGIAVDQSTGRLFVTGKLWPKLFEVKIRK